MICADLQLQPDFEPEKPKKPFLFINPHAPLARVYSWKKLPKNTYCIPIISHDAEDFDFRDEIGIEEEKDGSAVISSRYRDILHSWKERKDWEGRFNKKGYSLLAVSVPGVLYKKRVKGQRKMVFNWLEDSDCREVFDVFKSVLAPGLRWSSELRRTRTWYDKIEGKYKTAWNIIAGGKEETLRHCMVLDFDAILGKDRLDKIVSFSKDVLGANGVAIKEKKKDVFSLSIAFHFDKFVPSGVVHKMVDFLETVFKELAGDCKKEDFALGFDNTGSSGWMCKNIWEVEALENAYISGHGVSGHVETDEYNWSNFRGWVPKTSVWFEESDKNNILGEFPYHVEIFSRDPVNVLFFLDVLNGLVRKHNEEVPDKEEDLSSLSSLSSSLVLGSEPCCEKTPGLKKKPREHFKTNGRHDLTALIPWKRIVKIALANQSGVIESKDIPELRKILEDAEQEAMKANGKKKTMAQEGDNWIERQIQCLLKKPKEGWERYTRYSDFGNAHKVAGKLMRIAKWAWMHGGESSGFAKEIVRGYENLMSSQLFLNDYVQTIFNQEVKSKSTKAEYNRVGKDFAEFLVQVETVRVDLEDDPDTEHASILLEVLSSLSSLSSSLVLGSEPCDGERVLEMKQPSNDVVKGQTLREYRLRELRGNTEENTRIVVGKPPEGGGMSQEEILEDWKNFLRAERSMAG